MTRAMGEYQGQSTAKYARAMTSHIEQRLRGDLRVFRQRQTRSRTWMEKPLALRD